MLAAKPYSNGFQLVTPPYPLYTDEPKHYDQQVKQTLLMSQNIMISR